jgi:hypothetical protein
MNFYMTVIFLKINEYIQIPHSEADVLLFYIVGPANVALKLITVTCKSRY